jgi:hypothetical protein
MVEIGARVTVESEKVGVAPRTGIVTAVEGEIVHVHWDEGGETSFIPAAGSLRVVPEPPTREMRKSG